jgi:hypothetical protein
MRAIIEGLPGMKVITGTDGFPRLAKMRAKKPKAKLAFPAAAGRF